MTKYIGPKTDGANVATQSDVGGSSLSDATPDALTPDQAGAAGTVNSAARADHAHEILCAAAGAILPGDVAAEGTASSFARSDHTHSIATAAPGTITPDAAAAEGSSTSFARADHTHAIAAAAPSANLTASTTNSEGTATSFARSDHSHAITTAAPGTINPDDAAAIGSSASLARADHTHAITAAAPATNLTASTTNAEGNATSFARSNHTHAIDTAAPSSNLSATTTNAVGTSANLARSDHSHAITTGAAGTINPDDAASAGSSASLARADHVHAISAGAASKITGSNAEGTSTSFARADHNHQIQAVGAFYAYRTATQTLTQNQNTQLNFDGEEFDVSSWHNSTGTTGNNGTQGRFTPQIAGIYRFTAFMEVNTNVNIFLQIYRNNSEYATIGAASTIQRVGGNIVMKMNGTTDYVDIRLFHAHSSSITAQAGAGKTFFCGELIGVE